jgi:thioredoxin 1
MIANLPDVPLHASAADLDRLVAASKPVLAVFEVPDCEPCRALGPDLDQVAREFAGRVLVVRVEDAGQGWLAARYHLLVVPTLLFFAGGVERARIKGNPGIWAIRTHLDFLLTGRTRPAPASGPRHTLHAPFGSAGRSSTPGVRAR